MIVRRLAPLVAAASVAAACTSPIAGQATVAPGALATPRPTPSASTTPAPVPIVLTPLVPGWTPVRAASRGAVYDVPPGWTVLTEGTIIGFEDPKSLKPRVASYGAAQTGIDACGKNSTAAEAVVRPDTGTDIAAAALNNAAAWADAGYRDEADKPPKLTPHAPETITTLAGQQAVVVQVDAVMNKAVGECQLSRGKVYGVAATDFRGDAPTVVLVVLTDVGTPYEVPDALLRQILTTLRPVEQK